MRFFHTIVLAAVVLLVAATAGRTEEPVKTPLEGRWKVISARSNGGNYQKESIDKMIVTVKNNEISFKIDESDAEQAAKFVLRSDKQPAEIDFTSQTADHAWNNDNPVTKLFRGWKSVEGKAIPADDRGEGIYEIKDDRLTLCWRTNKHRELEANGTVSRESRLRPTQFQSHLYYGQFLFVLERVQ